MKVESIAVLPILSTCGSVSRIYPCHNVKSVSFSFKFCLSVVLRRTNELKADIDIPNDVVMKFKQFWSDFNDTPLKGKNYSQCSYL